MDFEKMVAFSKEYDELTRKLIEACDNATAADYEDEINDWDSRSK